MPGRTDWFWLSVRVCEMVLQVRVCLNSNSRARSISHIAVAAGVTAIKLLAKTLMKDTHRKKNTNVAAGNLKIWHSSSTICLCRSQRQNTKQPDNAGFPLFSRTAQLQYLGSAVGFLWFWTHLKLSVMPRLKLRVHSDCCWSAVWHITQDWRVSDDVLQQRQCCNVNEKMSNPDWRIAKVAGVAVGVPVSKSSVTLLFTQSFGGCKSESPSSSSHGYCLCRVFSYCVYPSKSSLSQPVIMFRVGRKLHCIKSDKVLHAEVDEDNIQAKTSTGLSLLHSYISNIIKVVILTQT